MVEVVYGGILLVALLALLKIAVPPLAFAVGRVPLRIRSEDDPGAAEPLPSDADHRRRFDQFAALGFRPVGITRESCWFITPFDWYKAFDATWMAAPDGRTHASFHRLTPEEPVRFGAVTLLEGGVLVRTTSPGNKGGVMPAVEGYHRVELQDVGAAELLARHQEEVAAVSQRTGRAVVSATLREVASVEEQIEATLVRLIDQSGPNAIIKTSFGIPALATLAVQAFVTHGRVGLIHPAFAICVGALVCEWTVRAVVRAQIRQGMLASHLRTPGPDPISTADAPPGDGNAD
jgi:hypothetical protein